jgi:hypothetical protein
MGLTAHSRFFFLFGSLLTPAGFGVIENLNGAATQVQEKVAGLAARTPSRLTTTLETWN